MGAITTGHYESVDAPRARVFFERLIGKRNADHPQAKDDLLRWYQDHGEDAIRDAWERAKANGDGKAPMWWFIDALNGLKPLPVPVDREAEAATARRNAIIDDWTVN